MKHNQLLGIVVFILITSCSNSPEEILNSAKDKIFNYATIDYNQQALYPNPVGKIDTIENSITFSKNEKSVIGYDFITKSKKGDDINIDGILNNINHTNKNIEIFPDNEPEKTRSYVQNKRYVKYSPIVLLKEADWQFIRDTIINKERFLDYFKVESDTIIDGNKVYTEQHIFLNPDSELVERWERINYFKSKLSQKVAYTYYDYKLADKKTKLTYDLPPEYTSIMHGEVNDRTLLKVGNEAPLFSTTDLHGVRLNLEQHLGKKIILNFSSIGCGYSHEALKFINQNEILSSKDYSSLYLSIWDEKNDVEDYFAKINSPFIVIPNAGALAESYGVSSTPTFFLINEKGTIEKVIIGNDKESLLDLKKQ